ncbi:MAG: hypothetical protein V2J20_10310, partial [Wenzhouxiangella sp.]|nr:hypothetical protein [Wenzhouxiangella sp.]
MKSDFVSLLRAVFLTLLFGLACSGLSLAADTSILQNMRAVHMGGNWGATRSDAQYLDPVLGQGYIDWLNSVGANWVGISVALYVDNSLDSQVKRKYPPESGDLIPTYTDEQLTTMVNFLRSNGFKVFLTLAFENTSIAEVDDPNLYVDRNILGAPFVYQWSELVEPENWPWDPAHPDHDTFVSAFWQSYTEQAGHFARLAETLGVEMFSLGTESDGLFRTRTAPGWPNEFTAEIEAMIAAVRADYSGLVTYAQHHISIAEQMQDVGDMWRWLWSDTSMDVIGLTGYFKAVDSEPQSRVPYHQLLEGYRSALNDYVVPLTTYAPGKPIVFVEFGYVDSVQSPWVSFAQEQTLREFTDEDGTGIDDGAETQADILRAFFQVNRELDRLVEGAFLWGHDWADDALWDEVWGAKRTFGVRDKLAEEVIKAEYGASSSLFGSITGVVVDQSDGTTPVHPVAVDLFDAVTGERLLIYTEVSPDGRYEIGGVPVGNYKVFFNAYGEANRYIDELYDGVPCDDGACDVGAQGTVFTVTSGDNTLDMALEPRAALSGRVFTDQGTPLTSAAVEVLDESGVLVGSPVLVGAQGEWLQGVPGPGSYFARTQIGSTPGYQPEVWNDVPCDDCDVVAEGTAIVVGTNDVSGIDFELARPVYEPYDCRARSALFTDSFEERGGTEIVFLTGESRTMTTAGQVVEFSAQLLDASGAPLDSSALQWCLTNTDHLLLEAAGQMGTITATGMAVQSSEVVVIDPTSGAEARGVVVMAELRSDAALIDGDTVVSASQPARGATSALILDRTPATESLTVGMVIALDDRTGILVRIVSIAVVGETIELVVEPAGLHEFYAKASIES